MASLFLRFVSQESSTFTDEECGGSAKETFEKLTKEKLNGDTASTFGSVTVDLTKVGLIQFIPDLA